MYMTVVQVLYTLLPLLIPMAVSFALIRFSLAARSSRARIKLLEKDAHRENTLIHVFAELENEMESALVELIDDPNPSPRKEERPRAQPILSPNQRKIVKWLNQLPIKKELAHFPGVRNSHAMIVSRDVKRFEVHRLGESVIRHWATAFIL